jgi:hypothetical protein
MSLDFNYRHPEWAQSHDHWVAGRDVYRGGRHVIAPCSYSQVVPFWVPYFSGKTDATDDSTGREQNNRLAYAPQTVAGYLYSHVRESREEYNDRIARAMHYPLFRSIVDVYVSAVLRTDAQREGADAKQWREYHADVDLAGSQIDVFLRQALTWALVYGRVHAVTDAPKGGGRPYTYLIPPIDIVDWELDVFGRFRWAVVRENEPMSRTPGQQRGEVKSQYRVWGAEGWALWRHGDKGWSAVEQGRHRAGRVPIATLFARRGYESRRSLEADSVLDDILHIDLNVFNLTSLLHDQIFANCFSQLAVPTENGEAPDVELGLNRVLGFAADTGARPMYLSPSADLIHAQAKIIGEQIATARQLASVGRGRAEYSREERSAATLQQESDDKSNAISSLAGAIESFDREIHADCAATGGVKAKTPVASYSRNVSLKALSSQIADATALSNLSLPSGAMIEVLRPIVTRVLRDQGQGDDVIKRADAALQGSVQALEQGLADGAGEG